MASTPQKQTIEVRGITLTIDPETFDDTDLLDALCDIRDGDPLPIGRALRQVAGADYQKLKEAMRDPKTGRVKASTAAEVFVEIFQAAAPKS